MRKKVLMALLMTTAALFAGIGGYAINGGAASKTEWSDVAMEQTYRFGDIVSVPDCELSYEGEIYSGEKTVIYPSGKVLTGDTFVASESGKYVVRYQVEVNGNILEKETFFIVMNEMYTTTLKGSSVSYGTSEYLTSGVEGLKVSLANNDKLTINKIINLNGMTKEDLLCKFYMTPAEVGKVEAASTKIMLTDIYDPNNTVTIHYKNTVATYLNGNSTYTCAYANGQAETGLEWKHSFQGPAKEQIIDYDGRWMDTHQDDFYGFYSAVRSNGTSSGNFEDNYNFFAMDYTNRSVYQQYSWYKTWDEANLVADLDDRRLFPENPWSGFTTGEVIMTIWGESYNSSSMNLFITEIAGCDLAQFTFIDADKPELTVDFDGYTRETLPTAAVGKPYALFSASARDIVDGNVDVMTQVYYNYYSSTKSLCEITNGAFTPKRKGAYTVVYKATDKMGNEAVALVDITAVEQTETLSVTLSPEALIGSVGEKFFVGNFVVNNANGNLKTTIKAVLKVDENVSYEVENFSFQPLEVGVYEIIYTISDYIQTVTKSYEVTIENPGGLPLITDDVILPNALIKNCSYTFPTLKAKDYSSGRAAEITTELYIKEDNASSAVKAENNTWKITADESVTLVYKAVNASGETTKEYTLSVVNAGYGEAGKLNLSNYFIGDGFSSAADENGITYTARKTAGNLKLTYVHKVLLNEFKLGFAYNDDAKAYSTLAVALTDVNDSATKLVFYFTYQSGILTVRICNSNKTYEVVSENGEVDLYYNVRSARIIINGSLELALQDEGFDGFTGAYANLDFSFEDCRGDVGLVIKRIYMQSFSSDLFDMIAPRIYVENKLANFAIQGDSISLDRLEFYDVIDPNVKATLLVLAPSGKIVTSLSGVKLDGKASALCDYQFIAEEYGTYSVEYTAKDYSGNVTSYSFVITVKDVEPPEIVLNKGYATKGNVGDSIKLASVSAVDNYSEEVTIYKFILNPDGTVNEINNNKFTAKAKGEYTVYYYAFDEGKNVAMISYTIQIS